MDGDEDWASYETHEEDCQFEVELDSMRPEEESHSGGSNLTANWAEDGWEKAKSKFMLPKAEAAEVAAAMEIVMNSASVASFQNVHAATKPATKLVTKPATKPFGGGPATKPFGGGNTKSESGVSDSGVSELGVSMLGVSEYKGSTEAPSGAPLETSLATLSDLSDLDLGDTLLRFLRLYGVDATSAEKGSTLRVFDPMKPQVDLGSKAYRYPEVSRVWSACFRRLSDTDCLSNFLYAWPKEAILSKRSEVIACVQVRQLSKTKRKPPKRAKTRGPPRHPMRKNTQDM